MKKILASVVALGIFASGFATTAQTVSATTYTKYTVSSKVRGNWKLKSIKRGQFAIGKFRWTIFKQIKITAHTITFKRLTSKNDLPAGDIYDDYKKTALSGKYYLYTSDTPYLDGSELKQEQQFTKSHRYLDAGNYPYGDTIHRTSKALRKNGLGFIQFYNGYIVGGYYAGKMTRQSNELVFRQGDGTVTRYVKG